VRLIKIDSTNRSLHVFDGKRLIAAYTYDVYPEQEQIDMLLSMDFSEKEDPYNAFDWNI
jgi:hypothetical protein